MASIVISDVEFEFMDSVIREIVSVNEKYCI